MGFPKGDNVISLTARTNLFHELQPKTRIKVSAIMHAATCQTCHRAFDSAHPRKIAVAIRARIKITPGTFADGKGKMVTTGFIADSEFATSVPPFLTVRRNPATPGTKFSKDMREFVAQRPIDLGFAVIAQPWI